jgi:hypothetical protein
MTREVLARARQLASRLAALFESDGRIAVRLNDAQRRLRSANDQLWSGLRPDALGIVYDDAHQVAIGQGTSSIAGRMIDALRVGEVETAMLEALQPVTGRFTARSSTTRPPARSAAGSPSTSASSHSSSPRRSAPSAGRRRPRAAPTCTSSPGRVPDEARSACAVRGRRQAR